MCFEGWGDASNASSAAGEYLVGIAEPPFASIAAEEFFNFQMERPAVRIDAGGSRQVHWPGTDAHAIHLADEKRDLIVTVGEEPHIRWRTYANDLIGLVTEAGAEMVITTGAFIGRIAHTLPVPVIGVTTNPAWLDAYGLIATDYQGPTGIVGVLHDEMRKAEVPSISLWVPVPHYLAANPNPKATLALLEKAAQIAGVDLDLGGLTNEALDFERRVDDAMQESSDLIKYVQQLEVEGTAPDMDPQNAEELITEIEQFLEDPRG